MEHPPLTFTPNTPNLSRFLLEISWLLCRSSVAIVSLASAGVAATVLLGRDYRKTVMKDSVWLVVKNPASFKVRDLFGSEAE